MQLLSSDKRVLSFFLSLLLIVTMIGATSFPVSGAGSSQTVSVGTSGEFRAALQNPNVGTIVITADIDGRYDLMSMPDRALTITSNNSSFLYLPNQLIMEGNLTLEHISLGTSPGIKGTGSIYASGHSLVLGLGLSCNLDEIYGGGRGQDHFGDTDIVIKSGSYNTVYGAGLSALMYEGDVNILVTGGTISTIYGGGNNAVVSGGANITVTGGTVCDIYASDREIHDEWTYIFEETVIEITDDAIITGNIFGRSKNGDPRKTNTALIYENFGHLAGWYEDEHYPEDDYKIINQNNHNTNHYIFDSVLIKNSYMALDNAQNFNDNTVVTLEGGSTLWATVDTTIPELVGDADDWNTLKISQGKTVTLTRRPVSPLRVSMAASGSLGLAPSYIKSPAGISVDGLVTSYDYTLTQVDANTVRIVPDQPESITVHPPYKTTYQVGEQLDLTGFEIDVYYSSGEYLCYDHLDPDVLITGFDSSVPAKDQKVMVTFRDMTSYFTVDIIEDVPAQPVSLKVSPPYKTTYILDEKLDLTGFEVEVTYSDGSIQYFDQYDPEVAVTGFDSSYITKDRRVTVICKGLFGYFNVEIIEGVPPQPESLRIAYLPDKIVYKVGEKFDPAGLEVDVHFSNGEIKCYDWKDSEVTISGFNSSKPVKGQKITVTCLGLTISFTVDIVEPTYSISKVSSRSLTSSNYPSLSNLSFTGGEEIRIPLYVSDFQWAVDVPEKLTISLLESNRITVKKKVSSGSSALDSVNFVETKDGVEIIVKMAKPTNSVDFKIEVYLSQSTTKSELVTPAITGTMKGSGSTGGGGGGGGGSRSTGSAGAGVSSSLGGVSTNVPDKSPVTKDSAANLAKEAVQTAAKSNSNTAVINLKNVSTLPLSAIQEIKSTAGNTAVKITADSISSTGSVDVRISIDPTKVTKEVVLSASTETQQARNVTSAFSKWYKNPVMTVSFDQKESFEAPVEVAVKCPAGFTANSLVFYSYDAEKNTYQKLPVENYTIDSNGYIRFATTKAGNIVISDGQLTK